MKATEVSGNLNQIKAVYNHVFGKEMAQDLSYNAALRNILKNIRTAEKVQLMLNTIDTQAHHFEGKIKFS